MANPFIEKLRRNKARREADEKRRREAEEKAAKARKEKEEKFKAWFNSLSDEEKQRHIEEQKRRAKNNRVNVLAVLSAMIAMDPGYR